MSKVVREAYESYGDMEFGKKNRATYKKDGKEISVIPIDHGNRHIKLISVGDQKKEETVCKID